MFALFVTAINSITRSLLNRDGYCWFIQCLALLCSGHEHSNHWFTTTSRQKTDLLWKQSLKLSHRCELTRKERSRVGPARKYCSRACKLHRLCARIGLGAAPLGLGSAFLCAPFRSALHLSPPSPPPPKTLYFSSCLFLATSSGTSN